MGLDIYFRRAKNKEAYFKYDAATNKRSEFEQAYSKKHNDEIVTAFWRGKLGLYIWHLEIQMKQNVRFI